MFGFSQPDVPQIDAAGVMKAIQEKKDCVIIDVRTVDEVAKGKIKESINIPIDEVKSKIEKIVPDKNKTVYVHCLSGTRSAIAANEMIKMGYKNVYSMTSGMLAWRAKKYPISI